MIPKSIQGSSVFPAAITNSEIDSIEAAKSGFGDTPGLSGGDMAKAADDPAGITDGTSNTMMSRQAKRAEGELNAAARAADLNSKLDAAQGNDKPSNSSTFVKIDPKKPAAEGAEGTQFMDYTDDSCMND